MQGKTKASWSPKGDVDATFQSRGESTDSGGSGGPSRDRRRFTVTKSLGGTGKSSNGNTFGSRHRILQKNYCYNV